VCMRVNMCVCVYESEYVCVCMGGLLEGSISCDLSSAKRSTRRARLSRGFGGLLEGSISCVYVWECVCVCV